MSSNKCPHPDLKFVLKGGALIERTALNRGGALIERTALNRGGALINLVQQ